jgi:arginine decarboxylase-like protein
MLAKNNFLTPYLLKKIWDLAKTDYKQEVLKFIGDGCIHLSETTAQFFINNIALQDKSTLHNCDFTCVCEFGKYSSSKQLSQDIFKFFFDCITASNIQEELLNLAVNKCSEMLKQVPLE